MRDTYLSKFYWKLKQRRGSKKAIIALAWRRIGGWLFGDYVRYMDAQPGDSEFEKIYKYIGRSIKESNDMMGKQYYTAPGPGPFFVY